MVATAKTILFVLWLGLLLAAALRLLLVRASTAHGSAGFGNPRRERDLLLGRGKPLPPGALFLSRYRGRTLALPPTLSRRHALIVGGSGTGKSRGYFLPNAAWARETSLVATDPKNELWRLTSGYQAEATRFAPAEPEASACFNFIPLCRDARIAEICARAAIVSGNTKHTEQAWIDTESAFVAALFAHASTLTEPTLLSAYRLFTQKPQEALLQEFLASPSEVAREQANIFQQTQERMRGSIVPVVAAKLQFMRDPRVQRFTSASLCAPDFPALRRRPLALYWCVKEHDLDRLAPLTSIFFSLLLLELAEAGAGEGGSAAAVPVPVHMLLDEFANIGVIPHFASTISLARDRGVSLILGIQGFSQLERAYGREDARTIVSNCATKVALSGLDVDTAEYFSRALGKGTVSTKRRSWQRRIPFLPASSLTDSFSEHARELLTPDEVRRIGEDKAIVIIANRRPLLLPKSFYDAPPNTAAARPLGDALTAPLPLPTAPTAMALGEPPPFPPDLLPLVRQRLGVAGAQADDA